MKIYVATSWRNHYQPEIISILRQIGHDVYDFRNPKEGDNGFAWSQLDSNNVNWDAKSFRDILIHPRAREGFSNDMNALASCDVCLLVLPCGRSAHLELGYAVGQNKHTAIYIPQYDGPELMYKMVDRILISSQELENWAHALS